MDIARAIALRQYQRTIRLLALLRAIWQMITPDHDNGPSLLTLPVEILQYIRDLLPLNSAACFIISNRKLLRILGSKTLHSLKEKDHVWERKGFLMTLEKDLPDWQLCHPCSLFHPLDLNNGPKSVWWHDDEPNCVQLNGHVYIDAMFKVRYQHVQLIMNRYRFGLPYVNDLKRLCYHYQSPAPDSYVESTITAFIEDSALVMRVTLRLQLRNGWSKNLIDARLPAVCPHNAACWIFPDQTLWNTLQCRRSHGHEPPCAECRGWKRCRFCSTSFLVNVRESRDSGTSIEIEVRRWFGSCKDPFDPDWRQHCEAR